MRILQTLLALAVVALFAVFGCNFGGTITQRPPTQAQVALARQWLLTECTFGDAAALNASLRDTALEAFYIDAYVNGPDSLILRRYDSGAVDMYTRTRAAVDTTDTIAYGSAAPFLGVSEAAVRDRYRMSVVAGYRTRALIGLGLIATPTAQTLLTTVATDSSALYHENAQEILNEIASAGVFTID